MPKRNAKTSKTKSVHDDYELPDELDFGKLRLIGFGLDALKKHVGRKPTTVQLDPDVARVFGTSESVNTVLRGIIEGLTVTKKRKKSA